MAASMKTTDTDSTLEVVRGYHGGWTSGRFDEAVRSLACDLAVEVPVNEYPTKESFARALMSFGALVKRVTLLGEFAEDRKSTRLNSSHSQISYAVFCLKKKTAHHNYQELDAGALANSRGLDFGASA